MKSAQEFFDDFIRNARLLVGTTVILREDKPRSDGEPNWLPAVKETSDDAAYQEHLSDMRKRHPIIDWGDVKDYEGKWRVIRGIKTA